MLRSYENTSNNLQIKEEIIIEIRKPLELNNCNNSIYHKQWHITKLTLRENFMALSIL